MYFWPVIKALIVTLIFVAPVVLCFVYIVIGIRQWTIGEKEKNAYKRIGALKAMAIAAFILLLLVFLWWYIINS
jgi:hypothetical protein